MQINSIPTKDNVLVSLEVGCSFHIGCSEETLEEDAKRFFYNFGPNRLEEYLQEELEESFRNFVKNIKVYRMRDSKTEMTYQIREDLAAKFKNYGVFIEQVNIMSTMTP